MLCSDMKFRQRVAWLGTALYLLLTFLTVYYVFDVSEAFNIYALDHVNKFHTEVTSKDFNQKNVVLDIMSHVFDLPKPVFLIIIALLYLQVFFTLLACTKPEPRMHIAYAWPLYLYTRLSSCQKQSVAPDDQCHGKLANVTVITPS